MLQVDVHYTPPSFAKEIVATVNDICPSVVADLCAGRGELLFQAEILWPHADFAAIDIDPVAIRHIRQLRRRWHVGCCDIFNPNSRNHSPILRRFRNRISLLLLNPPFSCRGNTRFKVDTKLGPIYASTAMSALVISLSYMDPQGSAVIVLPFGSLYNEKDRMAWEYVRSRFDVSILNCNTKGVFPRSSASVALVRLSRHEAKSYDPSIPSLVGSYADQIDVRLVRGSLPFNRVVDHADGPVVVHSTDLRDSGVCFNGRRSPVIRRCFSGPAVLVPRVGRLVEGKIAILSPPTPIVLTDCVIGLTTKSMEDAYEVRRRMIVEFASLYDQYVGTGAPFVTINRLQETLARIGIVTAIHV